MSITKKIAAVSLAALTMGAVFSTANQAQARGWGVGLGIGLGVGALVGAAAASTYGPGLCGHSRISDLPLGPSVRRLRQLRRQGLHLTGPSLTDRC